MYIRFAYFWFRHFVFAFCMTVPVSFGIMFLLNSDNLDAAIGTGIGIAIVLSFKTSTDRFAINR